MRQDGRSPFLAVSAALLSGAAGLDTPPRRAQPPRAGLNRHPVKKRGIPANVESPHLDDSPVGYTAVPYPVAGNGDFDHVNLEMNL